MAKRFTATQKWRDPWFRRLSPEYKLLWIYILDECDAAGVWMVDTELASIFVGVEFSFNDVLKVFRERIRIFDNGNKWWILKFVDFQYGVLRKKSPPHRRVLLLLQKYGLLKDYQRGIGPLEEEDKEEEEDKDKDKEGEFEGEFWPAYPHRVNKKKAQEKFKIARRTTELPIIMAGLKKYIAFVEHERSTGFDRQWKGPEVWLHNQNWQDEYALRPASVKDNKIWKLKERRDAKTAMLDYAQGDEHKKERSQIHRDIRELNRQIAEG